MKGDGSKQSSEVKNGRAVLARLSFLEELKPIEVKMDEATGVCSR